MIEIDLIDDAVRLTQFSDEWARFLGRVPAPTPFQTPEWLLTWWARFGSGRPHVLIARNDGEPVGVIPCFLHDWDHRRQLTLIGSGITDYLDPVFDTRHSGAIVEALARHLEKRSEWDMCHWQDLSAGTPLRALGPTQDDVPCSRIPLAESFAAYHDRLPYGIRRNIRRDTKKTEALGAIRFEIATEADPKLLTALVDLHRARWQRTGQPGMIDANRSEPFLRDIAAVMAARGMLRISTLYLEDRVLAIMFGLRNDTAIFFYITGFDPEYEERGCGRVLMARTLEYAHSAKYKFWDFLRGDEPYKFLWGAQAVPKCRLHLERQSLRAPGREFRPVRDSLERAG